MMIKRFPYWVYVVGVFVAWAVVFIVTSQTMNSYKFHKVLIFGCGFLAGVLGASIARRVYK